MSQPKEHQESKSKDETPSSESEIKSNEINKILGTNIDWTKLTKKDLEAIYHLITNNHELRKLAVRILRNKYKRLSKGVKNEARALIRDIIEATELGDKALNFLYGDDEDNG